MLVTPRRHPLNWYAYDVSGSVELLHAYVDDIERQVEKGIHDFHSNEEVVLVDSHFGEEAERAIEVHKGLGDDTWDLRSVFEEYFPNLQRRSALITLFAFFEHELEKLCHLLQKQETYSLDVSEVNGRGVHRASTYLEKVAGVDPKRSSAEWAEIQSIQSIRNLIVHTEGKLVDGKNKRRTAESDYVNRSPLLEGDDEVLLKAGYLAHVLSTFDDYLKLVEHGVKAKYRA